MSSYHIVVRFINESLCRASRVMGGDIDCRAEFSLNLPWFGTSATLLGARHIILSLTRYFIINAPRTLHV